VDSPGVALSRRQEGLVLLARTSRLKKTVPRVASQVGMGESADDLHGKPENRSCGVSLVAVHI
jgi:hypothetical protein